MSFGSGKLYNTSNRFSPRRGRSRNERDNDNNNGSPMPRWHASLSPERSSTTRSSRYQNNNNNLNESNMGNNNDNNNNPYYHVSERYQQPNSSNLNTSKSLDDEIISFLNSSPRPESFQTRRLVESEENTNNNGWGGTSRIYKNNNNNNDEEQEETFYNDGDSFLNEIRQEDESLYQMDQTLLNSHGSGGVTSASVRYGGIQSEEDNNNSSPEHGSPQRQGNSSRSKSQQRSRQNQATHTIYSTSASPHIKKRRERYLSNNRSRNTHPYNASSIVSAYSSSNSMNNNNKKKKKNTKKQQRSNSNKKISLKQQRMKDAALSMSKNNANNSTRNTSRRSFSKNNNNNSKKKGQSSRRRMNRSSIKQQSTVISGTTIVKKKKKKKKKLVSSSTTNQSQLILDRSAAPVLPPSPQRLKKAKGKIEAWSKDANNISTTSSRKIYRIPSSKYNKKSKKIDRPSSAGARLSNRYKFDEDDENFLNKKIKTITKQKKNIKSLKLRKRGMEQSIAALQKEIEARDLHIKELRNIIKRKERELVVAKGAKATEAVNTSGILNLSTDSIRSVGSQSYRERKNVTKLEKTQQKMKSEIKELRRREQRAVEIHGALRNTIDKLRNEKDAFGDQIDDLKSTIRSLKRSLEAERQYNKELIRTEFGENEAMNLQEEKINSHGSNNKVTNRILRQEISRLKSLLDVSRGKVKDANNELNHFKSENDHLKNENNDLKVQLKNIKMKDRLLNKEIEAVKDSKEKKKTKKKVVKVVIGGDSGKKNKNATSPIAKLMQKKIDDDKANLSKYQRLKSMYDRVQGGGGSNQ